MAAAFVRARRVARFGAAEGVTDELRCNDAESTMSFSFTAALPGGPRFAFLARRLHIYVGITGNPVEVLPKTAGHCSIHAWKLSDETMATETVGLEQRYREHSPHGARFTWSMSICGVPTPSVSSPTLVR